MALSDTQKKIVAVLLTDRHGALEVRTFEKIDAGRSAYSFASPLLSHVLYALVPKDGDPSPSSQTGGKHVEFVGDETWEVVSEYGSAAGTASVKTRARRVLAGVSSGETLGGDISQVYAGSISRLYRAVTMPLRISGSAAKVVARQKVSGPKRPTWNAGMEVAVTVLRSAAQNVPRSISFMRFFTDVSIPGAILPSGALRCVDVIEWRKSPGDSAPTERQEMEFIWPKRLTPDLSASTFSYAYEISSSKSFASGKLGPMLRERLRDVPVVLYLHGGAFALCGRGTHRELTFRLSLSSQCIVCVPEYRRPPDVTLEETAADVERAYQRVLSYGVVPGRVVFAGDSAGGGLALSLLRSLQATKKELPAAMLLFSPWVDLDEEDHTELAYKSRNSNQKFDFLPRDLIDLFSDATINKSLEKESELSDDDDDAERKQQQSMFFRQWALDDDDDSSSSTSLDWIPPILVHVGQCEVLHDQVVSIFRDIQKKGARVELVVWRDMVHVSPCFAAVHDSPVQQLRMAGSFVRAATNGINKITSRTFVQVEAISAYDLNIADGLNPLTLYLSSAFVTARLGDGPWESTDPCASFAKNDDDSINFDWGANGSSVVMMLGPLEDDDAVDDARVNVAIKLSASFGSTAILFQDSVAVPPKTREEESSIEKLVHIYSGGATLVLSVALVTDDSFLIPSRIAVDPPLRRDAASTEPAHSAPVIEPPSRIRLPPRNPR